MTDRTVHGLAFDGSEIVRYNRAGKWYLEHPRFQRRSLTLRDAVRLATEPDAEAFLGRLGGAAFDRGVRKATP